MTIRKSKKLTPIIFSALIATAVVTSDDITYASQGDELSTIGGVVVDNLTEKEINELIEKSVTKWTSTPVTLKDKDNNLEIDSNKILFDINGTVAQYTQLTKKAWYQVWKPKPVVNIPINVQYSKGVMDTLETIDSWDKEKTYKKIIGSASNLDKHSIKPTKVDSNLYETERITFVLKDIPEGLHNLKELAERLSNTIIEPKETFSILETLGEDIYEYRQSTLNFVTSVIYETAIKTTYEIKERTFSKEGLGNIKPGLEAIVNKNDNLDLQFINNTEYPSKLKLSIQDNNLKVELYSDYKQQTATYEVQGKAVSPKNVYRYSKDLPFGSKEVIQTGKPGMSIQVYRVIATKDGIVKERLSKDYYPAVNRVILISADQEEEQLITNPDTDLEMDLDGDHLADMKEEGEPEEKPAKDVVYDKGGNVVEP